MNMLLSYLTNKVGDAVPLADSPLNAMAWYLPPKSNANRSANTSSQAMGPGIYGTFGSEIHGSGTTFPRIARHFDANGGTLADPDAAPNTGLSPKDHAIQAFDLGPDYRLLLDDRAGRLLVEHLPSGTQTPIWGEGQLHAESWFGLDNGTAIAIETRPAADHADALIPARIDIRQGDQTMSLHADESR